MPDDSMAKFRIEIMDPDRVIYEGEISYLFCTGDQGQFELMPYHYPVLSVLQAGEMILDWEFTLSIKKGIVRFFKNECVVIVELADN